MSPPLQQLGEHGQSVWIDYLSRRFVKDGDLKGLVKEGVVGVTSNPTIFQAAIAEEQRPSLVILRSHIAFPSPTKTDDPATHGYALKDDEIREAKAVMGLPDETFYVPDDVRELYRAAGGRGSTTRRRYSRSSPSTGRSR